MARKTKEDAQATRDQLLDAAEKLFSEQGVAHTALNEIALAAGMTRGAVYWHFNDKADLLTALWERVALPLQQAFDESDQLQAHNPLERIRLKSCWIAEHIETDAHIHALMLILLLRCEYTDETRATRDRLVSERERCIGQLSDDLRQAIANGSLAATQTPEHIAFALFGLVDGICFHWLVAPERFPISTVTRNAVDAYLAGLKTPAH